MYVQGLIIWHVIWRRDKCVGSLCLSRLLMLIIGACNRVHTCMRGVVRFLYVPDLMILSRNGIFHRTKRGSKLSRESLG